MHTLLCSVVVMQSQLNKASRNKLFSRCELPSAHSVKPSNILTFLALMQLMILLATGTLRLFHAHVETKGLVYVGT